MCFQKPGKLIKIILLLTHLLVDVSAYKYGEEQLAGITQSLLIGLAKVP